MRLLSKYMFVLLLLVAFNGRSQSGFSLPDDQKSERMNFKFINNLIVIPVEINGVELSFLLDSGVNTPILFNLSENDSVDLRNVQDIYLRGFGDGEPIRALKSTYNRVKVKNIYNNNLDLYVILDQKINFSPRLGIPIHGIIGYDLFKDFVVEINYAAKRLKFYDPDNYKYKPCRKCDDFELTFYKNKPYIDLSADFSGNKDVPVKLLIDSGSSDALWLFEDDQERVSVPNAYFEDFLGRGLSGSIYGKRARVDNLHVGKFTLKDAKVAFPDSTSLVFVKRYKERNGSLGAEILKRFNMVVDYPHGKLRLKKNARFADSFKYNMSGIELQHNGIRVVRELQSRYQSAIKNDDNNSGAVEIVLNRTYAYSLEPALEIAEVRKNSPAEEAGLKTGDVILRVNGKDSHRYSLQEVMEMLQDKEGKRIQLLVDRKGRRLKFQFELKKLL